MPSIDTIDEMSTVLTEAKKNKQFPLTGCVDIYKEPFWSIAGDPLKRWLAKPYSVKIIGFDEYPSPKVEIYTGFGGCHDYLDLSLPDFFMATFDANPFLVLLAERNTAETRVIGKPDFISYLEVLRLRNGLAEPYSLNGEALLSHLQLELRHIQEYCRQSREIGNFDEKEFSAIIGKFREVLDLLPIKDRKLMSNQLDEAGLL